METFKDFCVWLSLGIAFALSGVTMVAIVMNLLVWIGVVDDLSRLFRG